MPDNALQTSEALSPAPNDAAGQIPQLPEGWALPEKPGPGRPTNIDRDKANQLLILLCTDPRSINTLCKEVGTSEPAMNHWKGLDPRFQAALARAFVLRSAVWAHKGESLYEELDEYLENEEENDPRWANVRLNRAYRQTGYYQWLAGKYNPMYADKQAELHVHVDASKAREDAWSSRMAVDAEVEVSEDNDSEDK